MWIYRSPIGILKIVRQPDGTFGLCHNETVWEACDTPQAEADNVFCHVTGCDEWDSCPDAGPSDLSEFANCFSGSFSRSAEKVPPAG